jgi:hypothetical protein
LALSKKKKNALKGQRFADNPGIQCNMTMLWQGILKNDYQDCFWQRQLDLIKLIASQGKYLIGNSSH